MKKRPRTLTLIVVPANEPDDIDGMGFDERRRNSHGWETLELVHEGSPDVLVRRALDLDPGVYGSRPEWDEEEKAVVGTFLIAADDVESAAKELEAHVAKPKATAKRLVEHAKSDEDLARVAGALKKVPAGKARGPAEEAAAYVRIFLEHVPDALRWKKGIAWGKMGIAWELRTPARCECAVWVGTRPSPVTFEKWLFRSLSRTTKKGVVEGRLACKKCKAKLAYTATANQTDCAYVK